MNPHTRKALGRFAVTVLFVLALVAAFKALLWVAGASGAESTVAAFLAGSLVLVVLILISYL